MLKTKVLKRELISPEEFKKLSVEEQRKILAEFRVQNFGVSENQPVITTEVKKQNKTKNV